MKRQFAAIAATCAAGIALLTACSGVLTQRQTVNPVGGALIAAPDVKAAEPVVKSAEPVNYSPVPARAVNKPAERTAAVTDSPAAASGSTTNSGASAKAASGHHCDDEDGKSAQTSTTETFADD